MGRVFESGDLLPGPQATLAGPTFAEWIAVAYPAEPVRAA
jgi:hypothetical protein